MKALRTTYRVIRSILFAAVMTVAGLYIILYLLISIPSVQSWLKNMAQKEASAFLKAPVAVNGLEIKPFNEVILSGVLLNSPNGERCLKIDKVGAGISLWALIWENRIEITYAEIIGLDATIIQPAEGENLNIQFLIDAFRSKEKKEKTHFDIKLKNVVIRKSSATFTRKWSRPRSDNRFDINHISISNLRADIAVPCLKNDEYALDLRRLSFREKSGLYLDDLSFKAFISTNQIKLEDFKLKLKEGLITMNNQDLSYNGFDSIPASALNKKWNVQLKASNVAPDEMACFYAGLSKLSGTYELSLDLVGKVNEFNINEFTVTSPNQPTEISMKGIVRGIPDLSELNGSIDKIKIYAERDIINNILEIISPSSAKPAPISEFISNTQFVKVDAAGEFNIKDKYVNVSGDVGNAQGTIEVTSVIDWNESHFDVEAALHTEGFALGSLIKSQPIDMISGELHGTLSLIEKEFEGHIDADFDRIDLQGRQLRNISVTGNKEGERANLDVNIQSEPMVTVLSASCRLDGDNSEWMLNGNIDRLETPFLGYLQKYPGIWHLGKISADLKGNNINNLTGHISLDDLSCYPAKGKNWKVSSVRLASMDIGESKTMLLNSDIINGELSGRFKAEDIKCVIQLVASHAVPYYVTPPRQQPSDDNFLDFNFELKPYTELYEALNTGIIPMKQTIIAGSLKGKAIGIDIDAPLIGQGKNKLKVIRDSKVNLSGDLDKGVTIIAESKVPVKNGYTNLNLNGNIFDNKAGASIGWLTDANTNKGTINLTGSIINEGLSLTDNTKSRVTNKKSAAISLNILHSDLTLNNAKWYLSPGSIKYSDETLVINDLKLSNGNQFIDIKGKASKSATDSIVVDLKDIDLSYIFDTLNINYVTFGGFATGKAAASNIFSKTPYASTKGLKVKNLSYNNAVLGDADLLGFWDNKNKSVGIHADITAGKDIWTKVRGNIFVTKDSLGLNFDAHKANLALIRPFLANILEKVEGEATADLTLYGTFSDITLVGKAFADTAAVTIGFTNVTYHGSDSVIFHKDRIEIPGFRVFDQFGNSARFSGRVSHNYFHDAYIDFNITDINDILCMDIDSRMSPIWYGKIFGSGSGKISGRPGYTMVNFNVTTEPKSEFTFVLDENKTAADYTFLTFSDKRRESMEMRIVDEYDLSIPSVVEPDGSIFELDLGIGINKGIKMNVIMDPSAGDKISAYGNGAMRIHYDSKGDKLDMYGRYTLSEGNYQFSFQDLILRDFTIKPGSSVIFNGDPLSGILDITAAYRVNANLSDLDKSFSNDPDLNRSSVPVEALLKVSGPLNTPDIDFDLALPTVTGNVERKVRSIVSSEEMLNQQVLYLLALNRFYTPQYAGASDGDLMSVASSTLSSQISNIMSQITDKVWLSPSFKSDRNDFSDMEVDLALSSQLFDNRLIINGNLGYRDRSVSNTNFIGDFDIEYLLNKRGNLRLKAYNHFNDAYYYLKSALTTQGLGIIYRKDFDDAFAFMRHKPKWLSVKKGNQDTPNNVKEERDDTDKHR